MHHAPAKCNPTMHQHHGLAPPSPPASPPPPTHHATRTSISTVRQYLFTIVTTTPPRWRKDHIFLTTIIIITTANSNIAFSSSLSLIAWNGPPPPFAPINSLPSLPSTLRYQPTTAIQHRLLPSTYRSPLAADDNDRGPRGKGIDEYEHANVKADAEDEDADEHDDE